MTAKTTSSSTITTTDRVLRQTVVGARRFSNYWWAIIVTIGATGFFLAGLSSYTRINLIPFSDPTQLIFLPQGLVMGLYGTAGLLLSAYLWLSISWNLGGGYNEFNKDTKQVTIFRQGFPGKNRAVTLNCKMEDVQAVKVILKDGVSPKRSLYLRVKNMREIPLTRVGQPIGLASLENQAAELVRFLAVPLEGL